MDWHLELQLSVAVPLTWPLAFVVQFRVIIYKQDKNRLGCFCVCSIIIKDLKKCSWEMLEEEKRGESDVILSQLNMHFTKFKAREGDSLLWPEEINKKQVKIAFSSGSRWSLLSDPARTCEHFFNRKEVEGTPQLPILPVSFLGINFIQCYSEISLSFDHWHNQDSMWLKMFYGYHHFNHLLFYTRPLSSLNPIPFTGLEPFMKTFSGPHDPQCWFLLQDSIFLKYFKTSHLEIHSQLS